MPTLRVFATAADAALATLATIAIACAPTPAPTVKPADVSAAPTPRPDAAANTPAARVARDFQAQSAPLLAAGNYLGVVELLERMRTQAGRDEDAQAAIRELFGTYATFVGQQQEALEAFATGRPATQPFDTVALARLVPEDAVEGVARLAAQHQAVFINEAHHVPRDRAFAATLLPKLRSLGFSYLAVETLADADSQLNARGYPVRASGFYSNEPVFGDLLRTAIALGFTVVPARHVTDRILAKDPKARLVVYGGDDRTASTLRGLRPLVVDQTVMTEQADTTYEDQRYLFLLKRVPRQAPFVLRGGDSLWSATPGVHDVTVIHPHAVHRAGRPNWLYSLGGRRAYLLSDELCATALDCVVSARIASEREDAVPVDVLRIQFSAPGSKTFALPPGQYVIEARDPGGTVVKRQTVTISAPDRRR